MGGCQTARQHVRMTPISWWCVELERHEGMIKILDGLQHCFGQFGEVPNGRVAM